MKSVDKAYLGLLVIFCIVLFIGGIKGTFFPDETVYAPGKVVTLYNPATGDAIQSHSQPSVFKFDLPPQTLRTSTFGSSFSSSPYCN